MSKQKPKADPDVDKVQFICSAEPISGPADVWINLADLRRAIDAHEQQILQHNEVQGLRQPILDAVKEIHESIRGALDRIAIEAEKLSKRGSN